MTPSEPQGQIFPDGTQPPGTASLAAGAGLAHAEHRLPDRVAAQDWPALEAALGRDGFAVLPAFLGKPECERLSAYFPQTARFRSRIVMERYAFGRGEYQYFRYPLPDLVAGLRAGLYPRLAPIANRWHAALKIKETFPASHDAYLQQCHRAGQLRPTPLLLHYRAGDYCCLHQDLYGDCVFPFQVIFLLSEPGRDFSGGELLLTAHQPQRPGRVEVVPLSQGDAVILAVNHYPVPGARSYRRASLRHGVSRLHWGERYTLGIIFHDAR
ncbi:2OG-Fe(II) oxygenase [Kerstersia sp.]|uniref:2OG-Fe(II) oxygenase n=1 Tax=Kerstersia sp. TaxID=1930783 RepID=UPI003F8FB425